MSTLTDRLGLPILDPQSDPVESLFESINALSTKLNDAGLYDEGPIGQREESSVASPGLAGRMYRASDINAPFGVVYLDLGTRWQQLWPDPRPEKHKWARSVPLSAGAIPGFFHEQDTGEVRRLVRVRARLLGPTSPVPTATIQLRRQGTVFKTISWTSADPATRVWNLTAPEIPTLVEGDYIDLNVTAATGTTGLALTMLETGTV